jgi:hypothetical protein
MFISLVQHISLHIHKVHINKCHHVAVDMKKRCAFHCSCMFVMDISQKTNDLPYCTLQLSNTKFTACLLRHPVMIIHHFPLSPFMIQYMIECPTVTVPTEYCYSTQTKSVVGTDFTEQDYWRYSTSIHSTGYKNVVNACNCKTKLIFLSNF